MRPQRTVFHPWAERELDDAVNWYARVAPSLASDFLDEVERTVALARSSPEAGQETQGLRRLVLRRFPYTIIYRSAGPTIRVLAVAHQSRRPAYWLGRD